METFVRIFFTGEALQRVFCHICNSYTRGGGQYKISRVVSAMLKSTLCIRLTPMGLAPFKQDITMIYPYTMMDKVQRDFLEDIVTEASMTMISGGSGHVQSIGVGNDVVVITVLNSESIWKMDGSGNLPHCVVKGRSATMDDASKIMQGNPVGGTANWHLDTLDLLKALVACIFRCTNFKESGMKNGICDVIIQMVIHEVGLTQNIVNQLKMFIDDIQSLETSASVSSATTSPVSASNSSAACVSASH